MTTHNILIGEMGMVDAEHSTGVVVDTVAEGTTWGNPVPVTTTLLSLLLNGSAEQHVRDENRTVVLKVEGVASDPVALSDWEKALVAEAYRSNTITWWRPGAADATVFEVVTSSLEFLFDDLDENRFIHTWQWTLKCRPYGRAEERVSLSVPGTGKESTRRFDVDTAVPTEGSLALTGSAGLGEASVYTHPDHPNYTPALRGYRVSGDTVSADATAVSGSSEQIHTGTVFRVPVLHLPAGKHQLRARLICSAPGPRRIYWSSRGYMGASVVGPEYAGFTVVDFPATSPTWITVTLAELVLPPTQLGSDGLVRLSIQRDPIETGVNVLYDQAWTYAMDLGAITAVTTDRTRLWLDEPTPEALAGGLRVGSDADGTDAYWPLDVRADQVHGFHPDGMLTHVVTPGATSPGLVVGYYPRSHTHAR